jgi:hypothetical protein
MQRAWEMKNAYTIFAAKSTGKTDIGNRSTGTILLNWIINNLGKME